jgi:hypothetical protein
MSLQELLDQLKADGLELAEDGLVKVAEAVFDFAEAYVKASSSKTDDLALLVLPAVKALVLDAIDKVDGKEG